MFKQLITSIAVFTATSINAQTFEIDTEACAGVEHIRDLADVVVPYDPAVHTFVTEDTPVFYAGRTLLPHLVMNTDRGGNVIVTNTSNTTVSFFFNPVYVSESTGRPNTLSPEVLHGIFNSNNDPLDGAGSTMPPGSAGRIAIGPVSGLHYGKAEMLWDSSVCLEEAPMLTSVENFLATSGFLSVSVSLVNNGETW